MSESGNVPPRAVPDAPKLPEVESPDADKVLDGVPSADEVVEHAQPADEIVDHQPTVDELLGRDRGEEA
jgi:hypothetical protein